jgi:hypothetical protein
LSQAAIPPSFLKLQTLLSTFRIAGKNACSQAMWIFLTISADKSCIQATVREICSFDLEVPGISFADGISLTFGYFPILFLSI